MAIYLVSLRLKVEPQNARLNDSKKPDETRERIVRARDKVEGWDCWGNEV